MELFSEIYSCYFTAMRKVLEAAQKSTLTYDEIAAIITENAFTESSFFMMPHLQSGDWNLLNKLEANVFKTPMTTLQKSWLKALLCDNRIKLFLDEADINKIGAMLGSISPLYENSDFHYFDAAADGDRYDDDLYIKNFKNILFAIKYKTEIKIEYDSGKGKRSNNSYIPLKLNYSQRDDKFRLIAAHAKSKRIDKVILNLSRIKSVDWSCQTPTPGFGTTSPCNQIISQNAFQRESRENIIDKTICKEPIVLQILQGRNALERYMLQFASMEKQTEYDESTNSYICRIFYDKQDETELLIRILSFGPVVKVLGPENFLEQIRERIKKQMLLGK